MGAIFRAEIQHYWRLGIGAFAINLAVLYYLYFIGLPFIEWPIVLIWIALSSIPAAAMGALQMLLHKRASDWIYLLQRPLSPERIFLSISGSGIAIIIFALATPALLILIMLHVSGRDVIELRHYILILYMLAPAITTYFCACFVILSPSRLSVLALAIPTVFFYTYTDQSLLANALLVITLSASIAFYAFRPDLSGPVKSFPLLLSEIPIQYGLLWGLVMVIMLCFEITWSLSSDTRSNPPFGTDMYVANQSETQRMLYGLSQTEHSDARFFAQQVGLGEIYTVTNPRVLSHPKRFQLPLNDRGRFLADSDHNTRWIFKHGIMLFEGRDNTTGARVGWLGPDGFHEIEEPTQKFTSVPWVTNNRFILNDDNIWVIDLERHIVHHRFASQKTDRFSDSLNVGENISTLLSLNHLYIFDSFELNNSEILVSPDAVLELPPRDIPGRQNYAVLELINGYLISALINLPSTDIGPDFALFGRSALQIYRVKDGEAAELIVNLPLEESLNDSFIYNSFILSPGARLMTDLYWGVRLEKSLERTLPVPFFNFPLSIIFLAMLCSMLSGVLTWLLVRNTTLPQRVKGFWVFFNALMGVIGLMSFVIGHYWRKTDQLQKISVNP